VEQYVFVRLHAREGEEGMVEEVLFAKASHGAELVLLFEA